MKKNISSPILLEDESEEKSVRPQMLESFVGQAQLKHNLRVFIESARMRNSNLDHTLFHGPPGLGKTTLAQIVAKEMGVNFRATSGPVLTKAGDLAAILTNLEANDVLFIDEIHRLNIAVEEILYSAMEDFKLDIMVGEGPSARSLRIDLPKFTLVGATTRVGLLSNPLRDRFGIPLRLQFYSCDELMQVINHASRSLMVNINEEGARQIASRARGTPRIAIRLLKRVNDFAAVSGSANIDGKIADKSLNSLEVDNLGLDSADKRYLSFIAEHYAGGPVGVETIAAGLSETRDTIEETIEPYLLQIGFIQRTPRGRVLGAGCYTHLGLSAPTKPFYPLPLLPDELTEEEMLK